MKLFSYTKPKMIVSDEGKHIRSVDDVYVPEHYDEEGNLIPEHFSYYLLQYLFQIILLKNK